MNRQINITVFATFEVDRDNAEVVHAGVLKGQDVGLEAAHDVAEGTPLVGPASQLHGVDCRPRVVVITEHLQPVESSLVLCDGTILGALV